MVRQEIKKLIQKITGALAEEIRVERPEQEAHGDYSTNIALQFKKDPTEIAEKLQSDLFEKVEVVKPGFINFFLSKEYLQKQVEEILKGKEKFAGLKVGKGEKINVEFISSNPTGPLHIGNGRGGFCGDTLANVLKKAGYKVFKEYCVNDRGRQIKFLEDSLTGKDPYYKNQYIEELKAKGVKDTKQAVRFIVGKIKKTVERMGIKFDRWFYESELYDKEINDLLSNLKKKTLTYEKDGAIWFKSTQFGDDKDRVLIRSEEKTIYEPETYFLSDFAYLKNKFKRGFDYLIIFLGAEHHGYEPRLKAAAQSLGYNPDRVRPIIMQLVMLFEKGEQLRMSKRTGIYLNIDDVMKEIERKVGEKGARDVSRFFFLMRSPGSHLLFDLDLAKEQSEKNPVFYVQYAHARICSILRKIKEQKPKKINDEPLEHPSELGLIKQLIRLPEIIEDTAKDYQVQRIPQYAIDLATSFHQFYRDCQVISEKEGLNKNRLNLISATKIVLENTLNLMGISAPEKM